MLATAKGYYNGTQIVLDSSVQFQQGQEVIVTYTVSPKILKKESLLSVIDSLVGAIPDTGKELSEYREERLKKYADID
ncbi:hypothetical protein HMPREF1221_02289 [Treponema socranskii subsp. paredis ATCC 35535]|jgi:hypothetical protein|nr:hypothetical protein HMPREF1221_02289 [Treponema socranskii subsp. paredis ATCC 35535]